MSLATSVTVDVITQKITDTTHITNSELIYLRSGGIHFKNKYKFIILKIILMLQIKRAFVGSNVNTKSTLQYPFEFCSDASFISAIFSKKCHLLFMLSLLITDLTFVFLLLSLLVFVQPDILKIIFSYHEWKQLFTQKCATNFQTYLENQLSWLDFRPKQDNRLSSKKNKYKLLYTYSCTSWWWA